MTSPAPRTPLEALLQKLRDCNVCSDAELAPVAILWTDPKREWLPLIPQLRSALPELICLGAYDAEQRQGPSLWLRCMVDRSLADPGIPAAQIPILYLPGVSRQDLRAGERHPLAAAQWPRLDPAGLPQLRRRPGPGRGE